MIEICNLHRSRDAAYIWNVAELIRPYTGTSNVRMVSVIQTRL